MFVCDIDAKALENLKQEIPGVVTKVCDVSKREDIEQMIAFGVDALGGLEPTLSAGTRALVVAALTYLSK